MNIEKIFRLQGGLGDTSYSKNSSIQKRAADKVKHITEETIKQMYLAQRPKSLGIADLGCSSGPNTLSNIKQLVDAIKNACYNTMDQAPEFRVYLNDLPTNDFNTIFQALPDFYRELKRGVGGPNIYMAAYPGTFYGRLFPDHSLHFIYSSQSLHWLSKVPPGIYDEQGESINKKSIYISERSPKKVSEAYLKQFQDDFSLFLQSRSRELISGGRMVLLFLGRSGPSHVDRSNPFWEVLYQSLVTLVIEGDIEEDKLDSYEANFYAPSREELEEEVTKQGCFKVDQIEMFAMDPKQDKGDYPSYGVAMAKTARSIQESMIAHHFGVGDDVMNKLFNNYGRLFDQELAKHNTDKTTTSLLLVLTKL
ncbi:hypothetical protein CASFOL_018610 [Castilleja foliolosa]|uniref:Uncharacterized protein n=1 Tax=Castilleja foliolosa TaxID=1961234 RepID=A0ABD3D9K9_9LAMI